MANNPFGDLTYARPANVYAGLPLDRIKETADVLQEKYNTSTNNANQIEIGLASMELDKKDEPLRQEATQALSTLLNPIRETGNWEDAAYVVQKGAKDVAANKGLLAATKNYQGKLAQNAALQKRVDDGKILQTWADYEQATAEAKHTGVRQNPKTGAWEGFYQTETPPDYVDIGKYTDEFLTGFKADEWFGDFKKGADGKWYKAAIKGGEVIDKERKTGDGQFATTPTLEIASYDEVYLAARNQALQNNNIKESLDYEIKVTNPSYDDKLATDPEARKAMEDDLQMLNYDKNKIKIMSDDELTKVHARENLIHTGIEGSALKHSYAKQKMGTWNQTWAFKMAEINAKAAASGGGDEQTVAVEKQRLVMMTEGFKPSGMPYTKEEYDTQLVNMRKEEDNHNRTVETKRRELDAAIKRGENTDAAKIALENATTMALLSQANIADYEKKLQLAVDKAEAESGVDYTEVNTKLNKLNSTYTPEVTQEMQEMISTVEHLMQYHGVDDPKAAIASMGLNNAIISIANSDAPNSFFSTGFTSEPADFKAQAKYDRLQELRNKYDADPHLLKTKTAYISEYSDIYTVKGNMDAAVSKAFVELGKQNSQQYAYLEMGTTPNTTSAAASRESNYSASASEVLKNNPGSFRVIGKDGKPISWVDNKEFATTGTMADGSYNINNITILGPTLDYVNGVGYCYKATEQMYAEDGKTKTGTTELLVSESAGSSALKTLTLAALKKGELLKPDGSVSEVKGTGTKGYDEVDDYVYKMQHQEIDAQLSKFQWFPPVPPTNGDDYTSRDIEVVIDASKRAKVTQNVSANATVTYDVEVWEIGTGKQITPVKNKGYNDLFDVELVLETYGGYGADAGKYKIPISQLSEVADTDLMYGKTAPGMQSTPRLMEGFKQEWTALEKKMGKELINKIPNFEYTVTSMTRSEGLNLRVDGDPNSGHLYGGGIDVSLNGDSGQGMLAWLNANSDGEVLTEADLTNPTKLANYRTVKGTNIVWQAHSRAAGNGSSAASGAGLHLDIKWADVKFQEEKKKLREYRANL